MTALTVAIPAALTVAIPGLTDEMAQARADNLRCIGRTPENLRDAASRFPVSAVDYLILAALLDQYPAKPVLTVGEMALTKYGDFEVAVLAIGRHRALARYSDGSETSVYIGDLTPLGRPVPEGWGQ